MSITNQYFCCSRYPMLLGRQTSWKEKFIRNWTQDPCTTGLITETNLQQFDLLSTTLMLKEPVQVFCTRNQSSFKTKSLTHSSSTILFALHYSTQSSCILADDIKRSSNSRRKKEKKGNKNRWIQTLTIWSSTEWGFGSRLTPTTDSGSWLLFIFTVMIA